MWGQVDPADIENLSDDSVPLSARDSLAHTQTTLLSALADADPSQFQDSAENSLDTHKKFPGTFRARGVKQTSTSTSSIRSAASTEANTPGSLAVHVSAAHTKNINDFSSVPLSEETTPNPEQEQVCAHISHLVCGDDVQQWMSTLCRDVVKHFGV